ncbi:MAG: metal ABC transporter substrate-binding protein [Candidatus Hydrothermarchaeaceae archaeon]
MQKIRIRSSFLYLYILASVIVSFPGCKEPQRSTSSPDRIKVVASIYPLSDFVRNVGGERVEVFTLLPPAASPHLYSPAPRDLARVQGAKLFVKIGLGFEFWAEDLARAIAGKSLTEVDTSEGVVVLQKSGHDHTIGNPHIWLDPVIAAEQVKRIKEALIRIDPNHQSEYEMNTSAYLKQINSLDLEIRDTIKQLKNRSFVAFHPSWSYFAKRYGLTEEDVIEKSPGREPTPSEIIEIIRKIRLTGVKVIFAELQSNPKAAHVIASEVGAEILVLDPIGSPDREERSTYLKLMRYNLAVIQKGMQGEF